MQDSEAERRLARSRQSEARDYIDQRQPNEDSSTARILVKVVDKGAIPTVGDRVFICIPCDVDVEETAGSLPTYTCDEDAEIPVVFLNPAVAGNYAIAEAIGGRWVSGKGSASQPQCCGPVYLPHKDLAIAYTPAGGTKTTVALVNTSSTHWQTDCFQIPGDPLVDYYRFFLDCVGSGSAKFPVLTLIQYANSSDCTALTSGTVSTASDPTSYGNCPMFIDWLGPTGLDITFDRITVLSSNTSIPECNHTCSEQCFLGPCSPCQIPRKDLELTVTGTKAALSGPVVVFIGVDGCEIFGCESTVSTISIAETMVHSTTGFEEWTSGCISIPGTSFGGIQFILRCDQTFGFLIVTRFWSNSDCTGATSQRVVKCGDGFPPAAALDSFACAPFELHFDMTSANATCGAYCFPGFCPFFQFECGGPVFGDAADIRDSFCFTSLTITGPDASDPQGRCPVCITVKCCGGGGFPDVTVTIGSASGVTNVNGYLILDVGSPGLQTVTATNGARFQDFSQDLTLFCGKGITIQMVPVEGYVCGQGCCQPLATTLAITITGVGSGTIAWNGTVWIGNFDFGGSTWTITYIGRKGGLTVSSGSHSCFSSLAADSLTCPPAFSHTGTLTCTGIGPAGPFTISE